MLGTKFVSILSWLSISVDSERANSKNLSTYLLCKTSKNYVGIDVERGKSQDDLVTHFPYAIVKIGLRYSVKQKRRQK